MLGQIVQASGFEIAFDQFLSGPDVIREFRGLCWRLLGGPVNPAEIPVTDQQGMGL